MEEVKFCYVVIYEYFEQGLSCFWSVIVFFSKFLEDISSFCGATGIPVWGFWWCLLWVFKARLDHSLACFVCGGGCVWQTPPDRQPLTRHPLPQPDTPWADTPLGRHPQAESPRQTPPWADTPLPSTCWDTPPDQTPPDQTPLVRHPPGQTSPRQTPPR